MTDQAVQRARRRARRLREFYLHLAIFPVVIGGLFLINWAFTPEFWWVVFPAVGWGIGLVAHGVTVFFEDSLLGSDWEDRKVRELLEREQRKAIGSH